MKYPAKNLKNPPQPRLELGRYLTSLTATRVAGPNLHLGRLHAGSLVLRCALGGGGIKRDKREGDHATPAGSWRILLGFYRSGRPLRRPAFLPMRPIRRGQGWCDDPHSGLYNRLIVAPFRPSHENLWRNDHLYDIVLVLNYNISPRRQNRGSAIFIHCAQPGFAPTEGCVALRYEDLRRLLPRLSSKTVLTIK